MATTKWSLNQDKLDTMPQGATSVDVYKKQVDQYLQWLGIDVGDRPLKTLWERFEYLADLIGLQANDRQAAATTLDVLIHKNTFFAAVRYIIKLCWDIKRLNTASTSNLKRMASRAPVPDEDAEEDVLLEVPKVWLQKGGLLDPFIHNHDIVDLMCWEDWEAKAATCSFEDWVRSQAASLVGRWRTGEEESEASSSS